MQCPICKKTAASADDPVAPNRFFPFCGERCKLIDLGRWLDEKYWIAAEERRDSQKRGPSGPDSQRGNG
ncbi:MAG: DNA gyrase inhibitor YacG [Tepidisphaeraceae bacterium]